MTTETQTFTVQEVSEYLDDPIVTDDHSLGCIDTCIRVIAKYPADSEDRNEALVAAAAESLFDFLGDFGVEVEGFDITENQV
jgi:hypothetical protein